MKSLLFLVTGILLGALAFYIVNNNHYVPNLKEVMDGRWVMMKQAQLDSLTLLIDSIRQKRQVDTIWLETRLKQNSDGIKRLKHDIQNVNFKDYTDPQLDSLVEQLYPKPRF